MMKKSIFAFLAVLTVFAMVMTGCPGTGPGGETTYTVTFDAKGGTPEPQPITGLKAGDTIQRPSPNPTKEDFDFDGWYKEEAYTNRWNFTNDTVTKDITLYAKWKADVGTAITQIKINGIDFDTLAGADMGYPGDSLDDPNLAEGSFEPGNQQPPAGASIEITAKNSSATVTWAVKATAPTDGDYGTTSPIKFEEDEKLYIKVVNGENTAYYVIRVYFITPATIYYGQPVINGTTIDPLWEANYNGPDIQITRIATNEVTPSFKFLNTVDGAKAHTLASAKAYWDDDGLYIYATVKYHDYYASAEDKAAGTVTERVTQMRGNYLSDSLEIMTCLRYQLFKADPTKVDISNQYRVGFSDGDADQLANTFPSKSVPAEKFVIGGNHRDMGSLGVVENSPRFAFQQSGEFYAWITKEGAKETGYKVICKVPWYLIGYTQTSDVFDVNGLVKDNAQFGLEFQLNTSTSPNGTTPSRDGLLTWNSVTSQGVVNCSNYGVVTLVRGSNARVVNVHAPVFNGAPKIDVKNPIGNITKISIDAVVGPTVPAPSLSYKWYQADNETAEGTQVGTDSTYDPSDPDSVVDKYFYVVVTNTNNSATGAKTASVTSNRFKYAKGIYFPDIVITYPEIEGIEDTADTDGDMEFNLGGENTGITYKFPTDEYTDLLTNYKTIKVSYTSTNNAAEGTTRKIIVKQGYNSTETDIPSGQYQNVNNSGTYTWTLATAFTTKKDGFTLQTNTDDGGGSTPHSSSFTIKITNIVFSAD
jgi:uncharacterized repeat protein (TIGR02543 family)